eukprot:3575656-Amphidinium_carterae.1
MDSSAKRPFEKQAALTTKPTSWTNRAEVAIPFNTWLKPKFTMHSGSWMVGCTTTCMSPFAAHGKGC